jgi:DnaJ family protein C protein 9
MGKSKERESPKKSQKTCLYEILGIEKSATDEQVKKAYRVRALQSHPDKDPSADAKVNFQKLVSAYSILKDPDSRKLYDETGFIEGEGFDKAADFFSTKFGRISEQDIVDFAGKYKGSLEEVQDVREYYEKHSGNVADLLEWIPLSEPNEVDRFIKIVDQLIAEKEVKQESKYKTSIPKLRKNADKIAKEQAKYTKDHDENAGDISQLVLAMRENRKQANENFFDDLINKYGNPKKKAKK